MNRRLQKLAVSGSVDGGKGWVGKRPLGSRVGTVPAWSQICASVIQGCSGPCLGALLCRDEATSDSACSTLEAATDVAWTEPVGGSKTVLGLKGGPVTPPPTQRHGYKHTHAPSPRCESLFLKKWGSNHDGLELQFHLCLAAPLINTKGTCYAKPLQELSLA